VSDVVEQGAPRPEPRPHRVRRLVVTGVVLALLASAGVVLDHRARVEESTGVTACVRAATSAVRYASARVDAISSYVRPTLDSDLPRPVRRRLVGLVSVSVAPTVPDVRRARTPCADVRVLWFHGEATRTRVDCLRLLDRDLAYLGQVTLDGSRAFATRSLPGGRCADPGA
jgi:hypothetical protein